MWLASSLSPNALSTITLGWEVILKEMLFPHPKSELELGSDSISKGLLAVVSFHCPHRLQLIALDKVTEIVLKRVHLFVHGFYSAVVVKQVVPFDLSQNRSVLVPMDLDPALVDVVGSP